MISRPPKDDEEAYARLIGKGSAGYGYTRTQIAQMAGISKQAVTRWKVVPTNHIAKISEATGISRADLRPSLYR